MDDLGFLFLWGSPGDGWNLSHRVTHTNMKGFGLTTLLGDRHGYKPPQLKTKKSCKKLEKSFAISCQIIDAHFATVSWQAASFWKIYVWFSYTRHFFAQGLLLSECCKETAIFYFVVQISTPFHGKDRVIKKCKPASSLAFVSLSREFLRLLFLCFKVIPIVTE